MTARVKARAESPSGLRTVTPPPPMDAPRFHSDAELRIELLEWVWRAAVAPGSRVAPRRGQRQSTTPCSAHRAPPQAVSVSYYDNYTLPSTIWVQLSGARTVALRCGSWNGSVDLEAGPFRILADVGLPAPAVLAGPCKPTEVRYPERFTAAAATAASALRLQSPLSASSLRSLT